MVGELNADRQRPDGYAKGVSLRSAVVHPVLLPLLACPACRGAVKLEGDPSWSGESNGAGLRCGSCGARYEVERGVPVLIGPAETSVARSGEWERKQQLGVEEYVRELAEGERVFDSVAREFAAFCDLRGTVLDVGCGLDPEPAYMREARGATFVGVDPLEGPVERRFPFVRGLGERLPFAHQSFDGAVLATSLDHVSEPETVLHEVKRVLRPHGRLGVWVGVVDPTQARELLAARFRLPRLDGASLAELRKRPPRKVAGALWRHLVRNRFTAVRTALALRIGRRTLPDAAYPDRARYHFAFFEADEVLGLLRQSGFRILKSRLIEDLANGNSFFVLAERPDTVALDRSPAA